MLISIERCEDPFDDEDANDDAESAGEEERERDGIVSVM